MGQNKPCNYTNQILEVLKKHSMEQFVCNYCQYHSLCESNDDKLYTVPPCLNLELSDCITENSFSQITDVLQHMFVKNY